jgi:hypothetical protein
MASQLDYIRARDMLRATEPTQSAWCTKILDATGSNYYQKETFGGLNGFLGMSGFMGCSGVSYASRGWSGYDDDRANSYILAPVERNIMPSVINNHSPKSKSSDENNNKLVIAGSPVEKRIPPKIEPPKLTETQKIENFFGIKLSYNVDDFLSKIGLIHPENFYSNRIKKGLTVITLDEYRLLQEYYAYEGNLEIVEFINKLLDSEKVIIKLSLWQKFIDFLVKLLRKWCN